MNKTLQAISLLRTWLDACNIPYSQAKESLSIQKADGTPHTAVFNPGAVMSTDMDVAMGEFHKITTETGYGTPQPVNRGAAPAKKRVFGDNLLARWRHSEMRTVPNASPEELAIYRPVARREANTFYGRNKYVCSLMGYDLDVAFADALIWTNTFLGRYRIRNDADPAQAETENKKLLTNYLRQRFVEVRAGLDREQRNVMPDTAAFIDNEDMGEAPSDEWREEHDQIGFKSPALRRTKVRELLEAGFARMGHDDMVSALTRTSAEHPCIDTRHAATRYLKQHVQSCASCGSVKVEE